MGYMSSILHPLNLGTLELAWRASGSKYTHASRGLCSFFRAKFLLDNLSCL
jgi:hypothetical protein